MNPRIRNLWAAALLVAAGGLSGAASAQEYPQGHFIKTQVVVISPGWRGNRYWDGHRYWERREWERRHARRRYYRHERRDYRHGHYR
jgi:hypothetical protein